MCRFIKFLLLTIVLFSFAFCGQNIKQEYVVCFPGCWKKLLAFNTEQTLPEHGYLWLSASFKTQDDSVFYDSQNDLHDRFYIRINSRTKSVFERAAQTLSEGDSALFLLKTDSFFAGQFNSPRPLFAENDSVVRVYIRLKKVLNNDEFARLNKEFGYKETNEIISFFGSPEASELAKDPLGFFWVEKPGSVGEHLVEPGDTVHISYSGGFLNGRIIDYSQDFSFVYGTPDQILKGLNYVIPKLKKGQTTKIILPSHLAFGESGSSNGSVPPHTPMLYNLRIN